MQKFITFTEAGTVLFNFSFGVDKLEKRANDAYKLQDFKNDLWFKIFGSLMPI